VERARKPTRLPVVLTRSEVKCLLSQLEQQNWLQASLLYGAGLRLGECLRNYLHETRPLTQVVLTSPAPGEGLNSMVNGLKERNVTGKR
ncbi:MAG: hypothetical protein ACREBG_31085, partial [Pyrinomonadaceae bacterium]